MGTGMGRINERMVRGRQARLEGRAKRSEGKAAMQAGRRHPSEQAPEYRPDEPDVLNWPVVAERAPDKEEDGLFSAVVADSRRD